MGTFDPAVRPHLRPARMPLSVLVCARAAEAVLVVAQAFVVAGGVVAMVERRSLAAWMVAVVAAAGLRAVASYVAESAAARSAATVGTSLRRRLLRAAVSGNGAAKDSHSTGSLVVLANRGVSEVQPYLTRYVPALVLAVVLPPLAVVVIATQDLPSAVIVVATLPLVPVFGALVGWRTERRARLQWAELSTLAGYFMDVVKGLPTLVAFCRADRQTGRVRAITHRYRRATMGTLRLAFASSAVLELVATLSVALVAVAVGLRLADGSMDLRPALVVLLLAPEAYWPLRRVGAEFHAAAQGAAAFAEADRLLHEAAPAPRTTVAGATDLTQARDIELAEVSVTFASDGRVALPPISARLPRAGLVAVTGPSGAGKTTLLAVLSGALSPTSGSVLVNGTSLADVDEDAWRSTVAWSPQRPFFVSGSVADNLRLGRPDATDSELWQALGDVGLSPVVSVLPGGLEAGVAEDGRSLSAGERARLAQARVVLSRRPIVLLDEPTAHLDPESEGLVVAAVRSLARSALVVAVAHSAAVAQAADEVIELPAPAEPLPEPLPEPFDQASYPLSGEQETPERPYDSAAEQGGIGSPGLWWRFAASTVLGAGASAAGVALTATAGWLIVRASEHPQMLALMVAIVAVRTFGIARPALRYAERLVSHDAAVRLLAERRAQVYAALVPLTPGRLGRRRGEVLTSLVDDVEAGVDRRLRVRLPLATALTASLAWVAIVGWLSLAAGLVDLGLLAVVASGLVVVRRTVSPLDSAAVDERAAMSDAVTELVEGAESFVAWRAEDRAVQAADRRSRAFEGLRERSARRVAGGRALTTLAAGGAVSASLAVVGGQVVDGVLSAALAAMVTLVPLALADLFIPLADVPAVDVSTRRGVRRLDALLSAEPAVLETGSPARLGEGEHDLSCSDLVASWDGTGLVSLPGVEVAAAARVGIVGPTGSGKSTLAALLVRSIDPVSGQVCYGCVDLREAALDDIRRSIGLLDDDPHVFASTVVENVRLARPGSSDAEVAAALETAGLGGWLRGLPRGLHTWLGDGHRPVSGGERARLGLARVILARHEVVVLDEPTAHLDSPLAAHVMRTTFAAAEGRSVVLITHRPEGLDLVDRVVDLVGAGPAHISTTAEPERRPAARSPRAVSTLSKP